MPSHLVDTDGNEIPSGFEVLLSPSEVGRIMRVCSPTVTRWAKSGKLFSFRSPGGHRRYAEVNVRALLNGDMERARTNPNTFSHKERYEVQ